MALTDEQVLEWARKNPDDPRAKKALEKATTAIEVKRQQTVPQGLPKATLQGQAQPKSLAVRTADLVRPELSSEYPNLSAWGQLGADALGGLTGFGENTLQIPRQLKDLAVMTYENPKAVGGAVVDSIAQNPFTFLSGFVPGGTAVRMGAGLAGQGIDATNRNQAPADVWANSLSAGFGNVGIGALLKGAQAKAGAAAKAIAPLRVADAISGAKQSAQSAAAEVLSVPSGAQSANILRKMEKPAEVRNAINAKTATKDIAEKIANDLEGFRSQGGARVEAAKDALRKSLGVDDNTPVDLSGITQKVEDRLNNLKIGLKTSRVVDKADSDAMLNFWYKLNDKGYQSYDGLMALIEEAKDKMKVYNGGPIKTDKAAAFFNEMYHDLGKIDDATVPGIQAIKSQAAEQINLFNRLERYFPGKRKASPNTAERTINNLEGDGAKAVTKADIEQLGKIVGKDYAEEIANAIAARDLSKGTKITEITRGAGALLTGTAATGGLLGGMLGGPGGAALGLLGAGAGYMATRPRNLERIIDAASNAKPGVSAATGAANSLLTDRRPRTKNGKIIIDITDPIIED